MPRRTRRSQAAANSLVDDADEPPTTDVTLDDNDDASHDANPISRSEKLWNHTQCALSAHLLPLLSKPEDLLTSFLNKNSSAINDDGGVGQARIGLVTLSQQLFRYIEHLAQAEEELKAILNDQKLGEVYPALSEEEEKANDDDEPCTLSGLRSLYVGAAVDAETIWGQVDLQNTALMSRLKKSLKKLAKRSNNDEKKYGPEDMIQLLGVGASSDEEGDNMTSGSEADSNLDEGSAASNLGDDYEHGEENDEDQDADSDEDSDARRIRVRMEKAMEDMSDNDDDNIVEEENISDDKQQRLAAIRARAAEEEEAIDPIREEMRDGFFDLHEMEAFADEEEEFLPDDAYGQELPENDKSEKVLPHVRDRAGKESDDDEGFDDEFENDDDDLTKRFEPTSVRRRKYRADDEVDVLYQLYDDAGNDSNNEDPEDMTAADFFGKPDAKLIKRYKEQQNAGSKGKTNKNKSIDMQFNDDNSWNDEEFAEDGLDWKDGGEEGEEDIDSAGDDAEEEDDSEGDMVEEDYDDDEPNMKQSTHNIKSKKLEEQTLRLEAEMMAEKPWRMLGEAKGTNRPSDSLLDSTPEFEVAFKPPPMITAEHTSNIEDMIKKRIIEEDWDDVIPRELPDIGASKRGGDAPEVSQEKSKLGLGELYEREYLKKTTGFDRDAHEKETEEDAAKDEMKKLFASLCSQLDALSNYHFAPRPVADEADVQNREDVPAIAMEEVLPLHMSKSRGVAPEEVYGTGKGRASVLKGESEMDQTERKRLRNAKKSARRKARKRKEADEKLISKLQPGLGLNNPYEKRKLREELQMARASGKVVVAKDNQGWQDEAAAGKEYQTSAKFFQKMQENVESMVHGGEDGKGRAKKRAKTQEGGSSSVYKL